MPLATPSSIRKNMLARAQASSAPRRPSPTSNLLARLLPRKIAVAFDYAKNKPLRAAAHALPLGLGALIGLSGEAELAERNRALMIARARDTARRQPSGQAPARPAAIQGAPYRPPLAQPLNSGARQAKPFYPLQRKQPPVSSRFVAQQASSRLTAAFPTSLAAWVQNKARNGRSQNSANRKSVA